MQPIREAYGMSRTVFASVDSLRSMDGFMGLEMVHPGCMSKHLAMVSMNVGWDM